MTSFEQMGVRARTIAALNAARYLEPNPLQTQALPAILGGKDCVIEAPTGSGKTLAFVVPMLERLKGHSGQGARALILCPTRELASQLVNVITTVDRDLRVVLCIGGVGYAKQTGGMRNSPDVIVACPGRLLDLLQNGSARILNVEYLVLDEADEMFDQGFAPDVERIMAYCVNRNRQTVMASATMPGWVQQMITKHLKEPVRIQGGQSQEPLLEHGAMTVERAEKVDVLSKLLHRQKSAELSRTIVFHRTKHGVKKLARDLSIRGHRTVELQGNLSQNARDHALEMFRKNRADVLVATNVAARGIDVADVGLVINYELPESPQWLTHRVGRTARNGAAGRAITFFSGEDDEKWSKLTRMGAPALAELDRHLLISAGEWKLGAPRAVRPAVARSWRPRGGGRRPGFRAPARAT